MNEEKEEKHMHHEIESESHEKNDSDTITIKKDSLWKYSTFILLAVVIVGGFSMFTGDGSGKVVDVPSQPVAAPSPSQVSADADDDARIGSPNAPVEIIEFSDFQCPFCGRVVPTMKQIVEEYGDKVTIVYRDFPLDSIHPLATPAAMAAECVREKGGDEAFFEYHDKIFDNQQSLSDSNLKKWGQELGYDIESCLDSQKYLSEVKNDLSDAQAAGGRGTPYFVINGKPLSGAQPFGAFKQVIDAELAQ